MYLLKKISEFLLILYIDAQWSWLYICVWFAILWYLLLVESFHQFPWNRCPNFTKAFQFLALHGGLLKRGTGVICSTSRLMLGDGSCQDWWSCTLLPYLPINPTCGGAWLGWSVEIWPFELDSLVSAASGCRISTVGIKILSPSPAAIGLSICASCEEPF